MAGPSATTSNSRTSPFGPRTNVISLPANPSNVTSDSALSGIFGDEDESNGLALTNCAVKAPSSTASETAPDPSFKRYVPAYDDSTAGLRAGGSDLFTRQASERERVVSHELPAGRVLRPDVDELSREPTFPLIFAALGNQEPTRRDRRRTGNPDLVLS